MDGMNAAGTEPHEGLSDLLHGAMQSLTAAWNDAVGAAAHAPSPKAAAPHASAAGPAAPLHAEHPAPLLHIVRHGETLSGIAHQYGTDWRSIARANHISDPTQLRAGTALRMPAARPHTHTQPHQPHATPARPPVTTSAPASPAAAPAGSPHLGDLSMKYETGYTPGHEAQAAGVVSNGAGDAGGVSYGAYQLASSSAAGEQVQAFLQNEGKPWAAEFRGMDPSTHSGAFATTWKQIASQEPDKFFAAQHAYIERTHYQPVVDHVQAATGLDIASRSTTVQNAVWSMAVQHGKAATLVDRAVQQAGPQGTQSNTDYDRKLVNALYDVRDAYVDAIGLPNLKTRYAQERQDALQQLQSP